MAADVPVRISRNPNNLNQCVITPDPFIVKRGKTVSFEFDFDTSDGEVVFDSESPFDGDDGVKDKPIKPITPPRSHKVKDLPQSDERQSFRYSVAWSGGAGRGNGTGEVPPG